MSKETIFKTIQQKGDFAAHQKVLLAVSTGYDSMSLLDILYTYRKELGIELGVAHVNHKQRPEAEKEAAFLKAWCKENGVPFHYAEFTEGFSEARARKFRYDFFKQIMVKDNYTALVTAHHKDDQAETVFMRLIRGGRLQHLAGMKRVQPFARGELIRPLLDFTKDELPEVEHFEDSSNASLDYFRNRVRNKYLPDLSKENPRLIERLNHLSQEVAQVYELLDQVVDTSKTQDIAYFKQQTPELQNYLLESYLANFPTLHLKQRQFDELLTLLLSDKLYHIFLKNGYYLKKTAHFFEITEIGPKTDSTLMDKVLKFDNTMVLNGYRLRFAPHATAGLPLLSRSDIHIRHRKSGDVIHFEHFSKKLRRLFIDQKLPKDERNQALVLEQEGEILAVITSSKTYLRKAPDDGIIQGKLVLEKLE